MFYRDEMAPKWIFDHIWCGCDLHLCRMTLKTYIVLDTHVTTFSPTTIKIHPQNRYHQLSQMDIWPNGQQQNITPPHTSGAQRHNNIKLHRSIIRDSAFWYMATSRFSALPSKYFASEVTTWTGF